MACTGVSPLSNSTRIVGASVLGNDPSQEEGGGHGNAGWAGPAPTSPVFGDGPGLCGTS